MSAPAILLFTLLAALSPAEQVDIGEAYTRRGEPKKAIALLVKAIASGKLNQAQTAKAEGALGLAYLQQKKPSNAIAHLETALKIKPKVERNWMLLGMAHDISGRYDLAVKVYRRATKALPKSGELQHELGMSLLEAGETKAALGALGKAVKLEPQRPDFLADRAYGLLRAGRAKEALEAAELATHRAPDSAAAFFVLGDAHAARGDTDGARAAYKKTLELDATFSPALYRLALVEAKAERPVASCKRLLKLLRIEPDHEAGRKLLLNQASTLPVEKSRKVYWGALKAVPKFTGAWVMLAEAEAKAGRPAKAVKALDRAIKLAPKDKALRARKKALQAAAKKSGS